MKIVLLQPVRMIAQGAITGQRYEWNGAGSVIDVDEQDAEELLKKGTKPCLTCSGSLVETPYFEIVR
jgi:hypothetical protein